MKRAWVLLGLALAGCTSERCGHADAGEHGHGGERPDDRAELPSAVKLSPEAVSRSQIRLDKATTMPLQEAVRVPAEIALAPGQLVHVSSVVPAQIADVKATIGTRVKKGDILAQLRSVELGEARAALMRALANLEVAQANHERHKKLLAEDIGSERAFLEAKAELRRAEAEVAAARTTLQVYGTGGAGATVPVRSPIDGEVVERHATAGEVVDPERTLFVVADTSPVWVTGNAYPQDLAAVKKGAEATLVIEDLPGRTWQGTVEWVSPILKEDSRTLPLRMVLPNEDGALLPGLFGTLHIARPADGSVVTVAESGVTNIDGRDAVFVPGAEAWVYRVVFVTIGQRASGRVEIIDGLEADEQYVAEGAFVLKSQLLRGQLGEGHAH